MTTFDVSNWGSLGRAPKTVVAERLGSYGFDRIYRLAPTPVEQTLSADQGYQGSIASGRAQLKLTINFG